MGEKETATNEEVERLKTKTKSNQSNDRTDMDDDGDGVALEKAGDEKKKEEARMAAGGGASGPQAAINNTKSNIKNRTDGGPEEGRIAVGDIDDADEAAINNTKSNIKNRAAGITDAPETTWPSQTERSSDQPRVAQQGFRAGVVDESAPSLAINEQGVAEGNPRPKNT